MSNMKLLILFTCTVVLVGQLGFAQSDSRPSDTGNLVMAQLAEVRSAVARSSAQGTKKLGLAEAISLAVTNNPQVLQSLSEVSSARAATGEVESGYYPSITGSASYARVEPNQSVDFSGLGTFSLSQENNWDLHLGISQVIYASGRRAASVKHAEAGTAAAQIGVEQAKMDVAYQVAQTFYTVLFLQRQIQSLGHQLTDLNQHLSLIQKKQETGSATQYDVLSTQVREVSMQNDLVNAQSQERKQLIALKELIGLSPDVRVQLNGSLEEGGGTAGDSSTETSGVTATQEAGVAQFYLSQALSERPEIRQARSTENSAKVNLGLVRLEGLPSISAQAQAGFKNGLQPNASSLTFNWNAGVALSVPIFNGFEVAYKIERAQAKLISAQQNVEVVRRTITTQVLQAYQDLTARRQEVKNSVLQLKQAQQALAQAKVQYNVGVITNVEYLDAESSLEQAQFANLSSIYHEVMSEYALKQAAGRRIWSGEPK